MTLKTCINQEFDRLVQQGVSESAPGTLTVDTGDGRIESEILAMDAIGCSFNHLTYRADRFAQASIDELKRISEALAAKLNYLLEPIRPVEVDRDECIVQLRSNPPQKDDDGTSYYELLTKKDGISLVRFNKPAGSPRRVIPANVTREVFQRLAADFAAAK